MNTTLPASYYQADNERLEAEVQKLRAENRELRETVKRQSTSIARYKSDMDQLEEHHNHHLREVVRLKIELRKLRGEK